MKPALYGLFSIGLGCCLSGCIPEGQATPSNAIDYAVVSSGTEQGISSQQIRVIRDDADYAALTADATLSGPTPSVSYQTEQLIAIFTGLTTGCNDRLAITSVEGTDQNITIRVTQDISSPTDLMCTAVISDTGPYLIIRTQRSPRPVSVIFSVKTS